MIHFPHADALCASRHPYSPESMPTGLFDRAMAEISLFHSHHTPGYEDWLNANGLGAADLEHLTDWSRLPPIYANYFKQRLLLSPTAGDALELTSSGTSGQKSRMRYDERSMAAAQGMVARIFEHYGWFTPDSPCNYLLLGHEPEPDNRLGTAIPISSCVALPRSIALRMRCGAPEKAMSSMSLASSAHCRNSPSRACRSGYSASRRCFAMYLSACAKAPSRT